MPDPEVVRPVPVRGTIGYRCPRCGEMLGAVRVYESNATPVVYTDHYRQINTNDEPMPSPWPRTYREFHPCGCQVKFPEEKADTVGDAMMDAMFPGELSRLLADQQLGTQEPHSAVSDDAAASVDAG